MTTVTWIDSIERVDCNELSAPRGYLER